MSDKIQTVEGVITLADGSTSAFIIGRDGGWQQWGATQERAGRTVDALESMAGALMDDLVSSDDEDGD